MSRVISWPFWPERIEKPFSPPEAAVFQLTGLIKLMCAEPWTKTNHRRKRKRQLCDEMDGDRAGKGRLRDRETKSHCYMQVSNNDRGEQRGRQESHCGIDVRSLRSPAGNSPAELDSM